MKVNLGKLDMVANRYEWFANWLGTYIEPFQDSGLRARCRNIGHANLLKTVDELIELQNQLKGISQFLYKTKKYYEIAEVNIVTHINGRENANQEVSKHVISKYNPTTCEKIGKWIYGLGIAQLGEFSGFFLVGYAKVAKYTLKSSRKTMKILKEFVEYNVLGDIPDYDTREETIKKWDNFTDKLNLLDKIEYAGWNLIDNGEKNLTALTDAIKGNGSWDDVKYYSSSKKELEEDYKVVNSFADLGVAAYEGKASDIIDKIQDFVVDFSEPLVSAEDHERISAIGEIISDGADIVDKPNKLDSYTGLLKTVDENFIGSTEHIGARINNIAELVSLESDSKSKEKK